jgi:hypothetical protein
MRGYLCVRRCGDGHPAAPVARHSVARLGSGNVARPPERLDRGGGRGDSHRRRRRSRSARSSRPGCAPARAGSQVARRLRRSLAGRAPGRHPGPRADQQAWPSLPKTSKSPHGWDIFTACGASRPGPPGLAAALLPAAALLVTPGSWWCSAPSRTPRYLLASLPAIRHHSNIGSRRRRVEGHRQVVISSFPPQG